MSRTFEVGDNIKVLNAANELVELTVVKCLESHFYELYYPGAPMPLYLSEKTLERMKQ